MGAVSVFMTGNHLRQPVDDDGPLSLRWSSVVSICYWTFELWSLVAQAS